MSGKWKVKSGKCDCFWLEHNCVYASCDPRTTYAATRITNAICPSIVMARWANVPLISTRRMAPPAALASQVFRVMERHIIFQSGLVLILWHIPLQAIASRDIAPPWICNVRPFGATAALRPIVSAMNSLTRRVPLTATAVAMPTIITSNASQSRCPWILCVLLS